ncbi:hypothetical protein EAO27_00270 [Sphingopyxis sp. YF1]|nr:hypothetical protein EAO27_00270 [Sphingopyxis sp. YF1]
MMTRWRALVHRGALGPARQGWLDGVRSEWGSDDQRSAGYLAAPAIAPAGGEAEAAAETGAGLG